MSPRTPQRPPRPRFVRRPTTRAGSALDPDTDPDHPRRSDLPARRPKSPPLRTVRRAPCEPTKLCPIAPYDTELRFPTPRTRHPVLRALRTLWTLPTNLLGHTAGVVVSGGLGRPIRSPYANARLYILRAPGLGWVGGVTLGHAILLHPRYAGQHARLVIAHELAHTRQHDVLGPAYLPLHVLAQLVSALLYRLRPVPESDPVHAHNPLEERYLFFPHHTLVSLVRSGTAAPEDVQALLEALAVE